MAGHEHHRLLFILAFRSEALGADHSVSKMLQIVRDSQESKLVEIRLAPFDEMETRKMIADMLELHVDEGKEDRELDELSEYLTDEINGNVGVLEDCIEELVQHGLIRRQLRTTIQTKNMDENFDSLCCWTWSMSAIEESGIAKRAHRIMRKRFEQLPEDTQKLIAFGAIIGKHFDLYTISKIFGKSVMDCAAALLPACSLGLLQAKGSGVRYLTQVKHSGVASQEKLSEYEDIAKRTVVLLVSDAVQKLALNLLGPQQEARLHFSLGKYYQANGSPAGTFETVNHYFMSKALVLEEAGSSKDELPRVQIFLQAAELAQSISAIDASIDYYQMVLDLLYMEMQEEETWSRHYDLVLHVHQSVAITLLITGRLKEAAPHISLVKKNAKTWSEKLSLQSYHMGTLLAAFNFQEAHEAILGDFKLLGMQAPLDEAECNSLASEQVQAFTVEGIFTEIQDKWLNETRPTVVDGAADLSLETTGHLLMYAKSSGNAPLVAWAASTLLSRIFQLGQFHPRLFESFLITVFHLVSLKDTDRIRQFESLWDALQQRYPLTSPESRGRSSFLFYRLASLLKDHRSIERNLQQVIECGIESGSVSLYGYGLVELLSHKLENGHSLNDILLWARRYSRIFLNKEGMQFKRWNNVLSWLEYLTTEGSQAQPEILPNLPLVRKMNFILRTLLNIDDGFSQLQQFAFMDTYKYSVAFYVALFEAKRCTRLENRADLLKQLDDRIDELAITVKYPDPRNNIKYLLLQGEKVCLCSQILRFLILYV